ncbi:MAG: hypothetical protein ACQES5_00970 [Thermodesulfobacteriota bacterium]
MRTIIIFLVASTLFLVASNLLNAQDSKNATVENKSQSRIMEMNNELYLLREKIDKAEDERKSILKRLQEFKGALDDRENRLQRLEKNDKRLDKELLQADEVIFSIENDYSDMVKDVQNIQTKFKNLRENLPIRVNALESKLEKSRADLSEFKEDIQVQINAVNDAVGSGIAGLEKKLIELSETADERADSFAGIKEENQELNKKIKDLNQKIIKLEDGLDDFRQKSTGRQDKLAGLVQERIVWWGSIALAILAIFIICLFVRLLVLGRDIQRIRAAFPQEPAKDRDPLDDAAIGWLERKENKEDS